MTTNWQDTIKARSAGLVEGFHDVNATIDEIEAAEVLAVLAGRPESAHAIGNKTTPVVDEAATPDAGGQAAKTARARKAAAKKAPAKKAADRPFPAARSPRDV